MALEEQSPIILEGPPVCEYKVGGESVSNIFGNKRDVVFCDVGGNLIPLCKTHQQKLRVEAD